MESPYSSEGVSMEAFSHMIARSATGFTERNEEERSHQVKTKCYTVV